MMAYLALAAFVMLFCMIANRLASTIITAPMVFLGLGFIAGETGMAPEIASEAALHIVAEIALIILLFLDAAQIDVAALRTRYLWPTRMLLIGLPLGFLFGTLAGWAMLPGWPLAAVALVAAILVPTDAALGQTVMTNPAIPERPRRALTVESGLNDGFALPLVLMMSALAAHGAAPENGWLVFGILQITLGPLAGGIIGAAGGRVLLWAKRTHATADIYEGIGALALAATAYLSATLIGGNGFIAAFAAGLGFGAVVRGQCAFVYEFTESEGQLLAWAAFALLGAVLVPDAVVHLTPLMALLIGVSLFVVRPLAIWISLIGTDATPTTRLFFGWFGPRGLATALFALLAVERLVPELAEPILHIAVNAVWISAVLHGITAAPGATWYATRLCTMNATAECEPVHTERQDMRDIP